MKNKARGFTIVELLIVIVIIAILAAITLVSYNGITARARASAVVSDMQKMNQAIMMYQAAYGVYPCDAATASGGGVSYMSVGQTIVIPKVKPEFIQRFPAIERTSLENYYSYICMPDGSDYKLIRLVGAGKQYPIQEGTDKIDTRRGDRRAWGYWSSDWAFSNL